jgi:hypothetical protein
MSGLAYQAMTGSVACTPGPLRLGSRFLDDGRDYLPEPMPVPRHGADDDLSSHLPVWGSLRADRIPFGTREGDSFVCPSCGHTLEIFTEIKAPRYRLISVPLPKPDSWSD